jgi:hypothetical protein
VNVTGADGVTPYNVDDESDQGQPHALTEHQPQHVLPACSQRRPDSARLGYFGAFRLARGQTPDPSLLPIVMRLIWGEIGLKEM